MDVIRKRVEKYKIRRESKSKIISATKHFGCLQRRGTVDCMVR